MNRLRASCCGAIVLCCALCSSCRAPGQSTTRPVMAPDEFFPIMSWELGRETNLADPNQGLQSLANCGFTTAAFVRPELLPVCQKLGLRAIVCPEPWQIDWQKLSDEQIYHTVESLVRESGDSPAILGYFLKDEPGVKDFPALGKAVAAVKKLAPGKLAYINLFPDYATLGAPDLSQLGTDSYAEYLDRYVRQVNPQFISYDNYQVQYSDDLKNPSIAASYFRNLLAVRAVARRHGLPFWNIVSSNQIRPGTPPPSPANLSLQAYTTLAAGASGLTWYTYYQGGYHYAAIDSGGHRTATWAFLKMVNDQVKAIGPRTARLQSRGVYFTPPAPADSLPLLPGEFVQSIESSTPVMLGEFAGTEGDKWAMIVNLSLERSTRAVIEPIEPAKSIQCVSPIDGSESPVASDNSIWLTAGQGVLLKLSD